jgi:hypothetical protein
MIAFKGSQQMRFILSLNGIAVLLVGFMPGVLMGLCLKVLGVAQ